MPVKPHKNQKSAAKTGAAVKPGSEFRVLWKARLRIGVHRNTLTRIMERVGAQAPERRKQCAQKRLFS
jgi:hypothetical protein